MAVGGLQLNKCQISMSFCPHCKKHKLPLFEKTFLSNWRPSYCRLCGKAYVNSSKSVAYAISITLAVLATISSIDWHSEARIPEIWQIFISFSLVIAGFMLYGVLASPIKHEDLVMYGKRPWWSNVILFGVLPVFIVTFALYLAVKNNAGQ